MKDEVLRQVGMMNHPFKPDQRGTHTAAASQKHRAHMVKPMVEHKEDGEAMFLPAYGSVNAKA